MDGRPAVGIDVFKSTQANVVDVADRVIAAVDEARKVPQLQGIQILVVGNQADSIRQSLRELRKAGLIGAVLSFFMLLFFLRHLPDHADRQPRGPGLAAGDARGDVLPRLHAQHPDDDGHAARHRHAGRQLGGDHREHLPPSADDAGPPVEATLAGVKEVGVATLAGTFSTIIVFLPLVFGENNQMSIFLVHVAMPIVVAMLASLIIAQTLIPMLAARMPPPPAVAAESWFGRLQDATRARSTGRSPTAGGWR